MPDVIQMPKHSNRAGTVGVVLALGAAAVLALWGLTRLRLENGIDEWLSRDDAQARMLAWFRDEFPDDEQIIVTWDGCSLDDPRLADFSERLRTQMDTAAANGGTPLMSDIITPQSLLEQMEKSKVDDEEAVERLEGLLLGPPDSAGGDDGKRAAAVLIRSPRASDSQHAALVEVVRGTAADAGVPAAALCLGGPAITSEALNAEVERAVWDSDGDVWRKSVFGLSALTGLVLTFVFVRNVRLSLMVLCVAYMTSLISTSLVPWSGEAMNMVLVVMPSLVLVLTLSAAIHVANYWRHAVARRSDSPVRVAVRKALVPCLLASLTTAIGLLSLTISALAPIRDFGVFGAVGVLISLAMVLLVLPVLLKNCPAPAAEHGSGGHARWEWFGRGIVAYRKPLAIAAVVLFVVSLAGLTHFRTDTRVARYFPSDAPLAQDYRRLEQRLGGLDSLEIVVKADAAAQEESTFLERMETVRRIQQQVAAHPAVSGVISLATFQPETERPAEDAAFLVKASYRRRSNEVELRLKGEFHDEVANFFTVQDEAVSRPLNKAFGTVEAGDELWRVTAQAYVMNNTDYEQLLGELDGLVREAVEEQPGFSHLLTGTVPLFMRTQEVLLESMTTSLWIAFTVIGIVMSLLLSGVRSGFLAMLPNILPIGMVFGLMSWAGEAIDIGTMLTGAIALGIAVDGTLHLLTWFRTGLASGNSRRDAVVYALRSCGPALVQTNVVVGVSLLMLFPSELLLISRFGWVMAVLLGATLLSNLVCLPILLSGPLGGLIEKHDRRKPKREPRRGLLGRLRQHAA